LGHSESLDGTSLNTAEDDPDCFFEDLNDHLYNTATNGNGNDYGYGCGYAMERLDAEQLSVHSLISTGTDHSDDHASGQDDDNRGHEHDHDHERSKTVPRQLSSLSPSPSSDKSWEGSEIVLDANSFEIDPSLLEKVQSDMNLAERSQCEATSSFSIIDTINSTNSKRGSMEDRSDASPRSITKLFIRDSRSITSSLQKHGGTKMSLIMEEDPSPASSNHTTNIPRQSQTPFSRRWSFSSSVGEEDDAQDPFVDPQHSRPRPTTAMSTGMGTTTSSKDYTSLLEVDQELFIKLSEEDDLRDFKYINNFSFDGDYLLSRILRERMRIQLKRDMLTTPDKDLYVETQKSSREVKFGDSRERRVFFMI